MVRKGDAALFWRVSCDNPTVGQGNVVTEVKFGYNDFTPLTDDNQGHSEGLNVMSPGLEKSCVPLFL